MADQTIHDEGVVTTAAIGDELLIWRVANSDTKRITKANFMGATITGGGTLATGGFTLTVAGNSTINGSLVGNVSGGGTLATGGFTLTVPATGVAALLAQAQNFTALQTFSSGFKIGTSSLTTMEMGAFSPGITGDTGAPTIAYTSQDGYYVRFNTVVFFHLFIVISTISGGTGNLRVTGLPFTVGSAAQPRCFTVLTLIDVPGPAPTTISSFGIAGTTTMGSIAYQDNATTVQLTLALLSAGDSVGVTGFYLM